MQREFQLTSSNIIIFKKKNPKVRSGDVEEKEAADKGKLLIGLQKKKLISTVWKIKIKGQHHKIAFRAIKKSVLDGGDDRKTLIADSAHGAGGSYALQIQVKVPLQTPYSPKRVDREDTRDHRETVKCQRSNSK